MRTASPRTLELQEIAAAARELAAGAIGIDSPIDTVQRVLVMGEDLGKRWDVGHVNIPRLRWVAFTWSSFSWHAHHGHGLT
jgi:hypothetical protein